MRDLLKMAIDRKVAIIKDVDTPIDDLRAAVCSFFRPGGHPDCQGCDQNEYQVKECGKLYTNRIQDRPMNVWSPEFSKTLVPAEKKKVADVPGMGAVCDDCYIKDKCPMFRSGSACSILWEVEDTATKSTTASMNYLIKLQMERVERARLFELMDGGIPDQNMSAEMDRLMAMIQALADLSTVKFTQKTEMRIPGATEPNKQSVFERFFGPKQTTAELPTAQPVVDIPAEVTNVTETPKAKRVPLSKPTKK